MDVLWRYAQLYGWNNVLEVEYVHGNVSVILWCKSTAYQLKSKQEHGSHFS